MNINTKFDLYFQVESWQLLRLVMYSRFSQIYLVNHRLGMEISMFCNVSQTTLSAVVFVIRSLTMFSCYDIQLLD